ncbi:MAG: hypothetical protein ACUZ77_11205 [Candidatus Brocadiales bacterium]
MKRFAARLGQVFLVKLILIILIQIIIVEQYAFSAYFQTGDIYVDTRALSKRDVKKIGKPLNHPYELSDDVVVKILSSIYYIEKGLFRFKKTRLAVFSSSEVKALAPLVADAFLKADVTDYVVVYSAIERVLLSDLHTYGMLFISGDELNVVFTTVRQRLSYNITESQKARIERVFDKPVNIKKSTFWELVPVEVQTLKEGHRNWLLIDLKALPTTTPLFYSSREEVMAGTIAKEQVLPDTAYESELEERLRRLEKNAGLKPAVRFRESPEPEVMKEDTYIRVDIAKDYMPKRPPNLIVEEGEKEREKIKNLDIKEKLRRLRDFRDEGLITEEDYRSKKAQLIRQEQKDKSVREKLKELRDMRDERLISAKDYEALKKELLDKWF